MRDTSLRRLPLCIAALLTVLMAANLAAVPPSPDAIKLWTAQGILDQKMADWRAAEGEYGSEPSPNPPYDREKLRASIAAGEQTVDTIRVIVVLVDFDDNQHVLDSTAFDSLLFSQQLDPVHNPTGSMTDFYTENSYGRVFIEGHVFGWYRMPWPYSYYVADPANLAKDAVSAVDPYVDFREFVAENSATFNGLILVHAGPGEETGECTNCIWSHKGSFSAFADSIWVTEYTVNPEVYYGTVISQVGVFCHEYGHIMGLRDYYDTQYNPGSSGLGDWSLMAGGSWNGVGGNSPSHIDAYNKTVLGFVSATEIHGDKSPISMLNAPIPQVESEPVVYKLMNDSATWWREYWLVENRQKVGFDRALPGAGLLIYHVDLQMSTNNDPSRYRVAVEQADGLNELAYGGPGGQGDTGDPWPGSYNNRNFHDLSTPNSRTNLGYISQMGVWNISDSDSLMHADLEARFTHPWAILAPGTDSLRFFDGYMGVGEGNGDRVIDAGERVYFYCTVRNVMGMSYNPLAKLSVDNPDIQFEVSAVPVGSGTAFNPTLDQSTQEPIIFDVPETVTPGTLHFTLTVTTDLQLDTVHQETYQFPFPFDKPLGNPTAVGDDNDGSLPDRFELSQNYPNPFNPTTRISYSVAARPGQGPAHTNLTVFNVLGQKVRTLVDKVQTAGNYSVEWDGTDESGAKVSSGIYFYRITSGDFVDTKKMALLK